jgi:hypothetical protein
MHYGNTDLLSIVNNNCRVCRNPKGGILLPISIHNNLIVRFSRNLKETRRTLYGI